MKKFVFIFLAIILIASVALVGCAGQQATPPSAPAPAAVKTLTIGAAAPLSGPAAPWGLGLQAYYNMQIDDINSAGGFIVNGQKYNLKLIAYDSKFVPTEAVSAVKRLVELDKVKYVANVGAAQVIPCQAITEPAKVMTWALASAGKRMINPANPYTFQYSPDHETAIIMYSYLAKNKGIKTVAVLAPDNEVGAAYMDMIDFATKGLNLQIASKKLADPGANDYYPVLTPIVALKPDFFDVSQFGVGSQALIIKQTRELGFKGPMFSVSPDMDTFMSVAGPDALENVYITPYLDKFTPEQTALKDEVTKKLGAPYWLGAPAITMVTFIPMMIDAWKGAGTVDDTDAVIKYLTTHKIKTLWGEAYMGGAKYYGIARVLMLPTPIGLIQKDGKIIQATIDPMPAGLMD